MMKTRAEPCLAAWSEGLKTAIFEGVTPFSIKICFLKFSHGTCPLPSQSYDKSLESSQHHAGHFEPALKSVASAPCQLPHRETQTPAPALLIFMTTHLSEVLSLQSTALPQHAAGVRDGAGGPPHTAWGRTQHHRPPWRGRGRPHNQEHEGLKTTAYLYKMCSNPGSLLRFTR